MESEGGVAPRVVAFVDLDYFFAQVEEIQRPDLRDKPVVVCVYSGRGPTSGVVSSANYVARSYGVRAGIPISRAVRLLPPTSAFLPVRMQLYSEFSSRVMTLLREYSDRLRVESIDEASMDITGRVGGDYVRAETLAREIKERMRQELGLKCTIGIAPNRTVAKIAADLSKPDGMKVVIPSQVRSFLSPLDVEKLPGVGRKLAKALEGLGVRTLGQLARLQPEALEEVVGLKRASYLVRAAAGNLDEIISERGPRKQLSRIITLKMDTRDVDEILEQLKPSLGQLIEKMREGMTMARNIGIYVVTEDLQPITRQRTISGPISSDTCYEAIRRMLTELVADKPTIRIRRAGIRFSGFIAAGGQQTLTDFTADNP
ncbi:MAG: DNA polymerase IV [Nitrososphaerota archaeon]